MSGCGCSKETPCEDKKSQQENHPSIAEANNSKNCDNKYKLNILLYSLSLAKYVINQAQSSL